MAKGKPQHVVPHENGWAVIGQGNERYSKITGNQAEAIGYARNTAINQQPELFIHGKNGQIRERNSYGNDPKYRKG